MGSAAARSWPGAGLVSGADDVARLVGEVGAAAQQRDRTAGMRHAVRTADDAALVSLDASRVLPVAAEVAGLLPWPGGLRRGTTVAAIGSASLVMTLLVYAMAAGSWAAVVGMPAFGALAAHEVYGIDLARLPLVPHPGPDWPTVVAALLDGVDVVVVDVPAVTDGTARSLIARARSRGAVLITTTVWPGVDVTIDATERTWHGLGVGRGRLRRQDITLCATGKGRAAHPRQVVTSLPPPSIATRTGVPLHLPPITPPVTAATLRAVRPHDTSARPSVDDHDPARSDPWAALRDRLPPIARSRPRQG